MDHENYGIGVDIWSLGCILAELFLSDTLFDKRNKIEMLWDIFCMLGNPDFENWPGYEFSRQTKDSLPKFPPTGLSFIFNNHRDFDKDALDLLTRMLSVDPWKRPSCQQILEHPFLTF